MFYGATQKLHTDTSLSFCDIYSYMSAACRSTEIRFLDHVARIIMEMDASVMFNDRITSEYHLKWCHPSVCPPVSR